MIAAIEWLYCFEDNLIGLIVCSKGLIDNSYIVINELLGLRRYVVIHDQQIGDY